MDIVIKDRAIKQAKYKQETYQGVVINPNRELEGKDLITSYDVKLATENQVVRNVYNTSSEYFQLGAYVTLIRSNRLNWIITGRGATTIDAKKAEGVAVNAVIGESYVGSCYVQ